MRNENKNPKKESQNLKLNKKRFFACHEMNEMNENKNSEAGQRNNDA